MKNNYGHGSDVGCQRDHNEDHYQIDEQARLFVLADGMGGHECGEVASAIVTDSVIREVQEGTSLVDAIRQAHYDVLQAGRDGRGKPGMGATCVALKFKQNHEYELAWVGDSRAYLWNGDELRQLTHDQTFVQLLVDRNAISEEEAREHPDSSILSQAVGQDKDEIHPDSLQGELYQGEFLLLCSDGLTGEVTDEEIAACLSGDEKTLQQQVDELIERARHNGGSDNITVLLIAASETAQKPPLLAKTQQYSAITDTQINKAFEPERARWKTAMVSAVVGVVLFVLLIWAFSYWSHSEADEEELKPQVEETPGVVNKTDAAKTDEITTQAEESIPRVTPEQPEYLLPDMPASVQQPLKVILSDEQQQSRQIDLNPQTPDGE